MAGIDDDDPWGAVMLSTLPGARLRQGKGGRDDIGDTRHLVERASPMLEVRQYEGPDASGEMAGDIAQLLDLSIAAQPGRADLWMMRFELYRAQGMQQRFAAALRAARANGAVSGQLDWDAVNRLWSGFQPPAPCRSDAPLERRRFNDIALQTAPEALDALTRAYLPLRATAGFHDKWAAALATVLQPPSPLQLLPSLQPDPRRSARLLLKREDLRPLEPAREFALAQAWLAKLMGRSELVAAREFDAHVLQLADAAARLRLGCTIYLGAVERAERPELVLALQQRGARCELSLDSDPRAAALRHWRCAPERVHLGLSLGTGPHPYPVIGSDFQSLLGRETEAQYQALERPAPTRLLVAARYSRADAIGFMLPQLRQAAVELVCVEPEAPAADDAAPDRWSGAYAQRRREHTWLRASGRISYLGVDDAAAQLTQHELAQREGLRLGLEDARALTYARRRVQATGTAQDVLVLVGAASKSDVP